MHNTREKLIELMKDTHVNGAWHHWGYEESADHLIANGVTVQKWIPVTERLPEKGETVLVYHADMGNWQPVMEATLYEDGWLTKFDFDPCENPNITHWMPLPEPPKED